tara:strand:+ start:1316 stop:1639 length:324 start_codon:yes stop_codon:yes gene_type:complete
MYPKMSDYIQNLPSDQISSTQPELKIVDYLFEKDGSQQKIGGLMTEFKSAVFVGALFVLLSIPHVDVLISHLIPIANNNVVLMILKAIFFMIIYYIVENFWFIRKKE